MTGNQEISRDTTCKNARILLDVLAKQGLRHLVVSPGSRNAPLLIAAAARDVFRKTVINDERTAGFFALGLGVVSREPAALVCTSGTAFYNYAPAIAEAYYQKIPMIVITADRPGQWIDQDDSQTLRQPSTLSNIVKKSFDIPFDGGMRIACENPEYSDEHEWFVNRVANEAYLTAVSGTPGPVHINIQFAAPLGSTEPRSEISDKTRIVELTGADRSLTVEKNKEIAEHLCNRKVLVVAGFMPPDNKLNRVLGRFLQWPNVTLMCETLSNLHLGREYQMIDSLLCNADAETRKRLAPDVVISIGGSLVSRMLKEFIRKSGCTEHWTLADTDLSVDCFQRLTRHIDVPPARFFSGIDKAFRKIYRNGRISDSRDYAGYFEAERRQAAQLNARKLMDAGWSELTAFHMVFNIIPKEYNLILSNGTPVRYAQLLLGDDFHACYCNRGVSGIEGSNATALGASAVYPRTTLLVTGDMSFAYCPEILNMAEKGGDLRIIVINNRGGGIFRFINTTRNLETREEYFCADPDLSIEKVTESYGWTYVSANCEKELKESLEVLKNTPKTLLEIKVEPETSAETLINYLKR